MSSLNLVDTIKSTLSTKSALALVLSFMLTACGGGAGGDDGIVDSANVGSQTSTDDTTQNIPATVSAVQISTQPQSITKNRGETASFSVSASGGGSLNFQWMKNQQSIQGATNNTLVLTNVSSSDAALYSVIVSNSAGPVSSLSAQLTVNVPVVVVPEVTEPEVTEPEVTEPEVTEPEVTEPEVTEPEVTEPEVTEPEVTEPEVTEPEVTEPEVTEPEVTEPEVTEPEVTEPEVTEPEVTEPEVTEPEVTEPEVTEPEVTEPEVTEPEVTEPEVINPVVIVSQPQALTVEENSEVSFSVQVTGDGNISYQWYKNSQVINGATAANLSISSVTMDDAGAYSVRIENSEGMVLSNSADLSVTALPEPIVIVSQPQSLTVEENAAATFEVQVTGDGEITYQWLKDGGVINGATSSTFSLANVTLSDAAVYSVIITNSQGPVISEAAPLSVTEIQLPSTLELTWDIPQERADGSDLPLYEINGYVIVYGTDQNNLSNQLSVDGASTTNTILEDLASGTYYFAIATVDSDGVQGEYSSVIQESI